ncbi:Eco57I restriction-modification methylase domain-containing protein [Thalassospira sp. MA62]|nr:Eco57I restriction-modification methylase domain-containing protein [Thalassospira sp. MA62]
MNKASFLLQGRNPDVLSCIANLSNDEVFTPPEFANQMLDTLADRWKRDNDGANIWSDPNVKFLDPCTKSGVFLREITKRLITGLESELPDLQARVDHILGRQIFGIGITEITAMLARRSLYCSKHANGRHSITRGFNSDDGNVWFERVNHSWKNGKCKFCGANQKKLDRGDDRESHAYAFIHTTNIQAQLDEQFGGGMHFDVVIGNPPYQLDDGGHGTSAAPIYHKFVDQAKALDPRYLTMVIPSRWFAGGKGLDDFRRTMLSDNRIRSLNDFLSAADVFPGVGLKGGVCYFLWDKENPGECEINTNFKDWIHSSSSRPLMENGVDIFIRFNEGVSILKKIIKKETGKDNDLSLPDEKKFEILVSSRKPFGLTTTFKGKKTPKENDLKVYQNGGIGYTSVENISSGHDYLGKWKIFTGRAAPGTGNKDTYPHKIISTPFIGEPNSISSETYLCIGGFNSKAEAESALSYLSCRLTRFLILLHKPSQDTTRRVYRFVPKQCWDQKWTDQLLYEKYGLSAEEIAFVEKIVRPMEVDLFDVLVED